MRGDFGCTAHVDTTHAEVILEPSIDTLNRAAFSEPRGFVWCEAGVFAVCAIVIDQRDMTQRKADRPASHQASCRATDVAAGSVARASALRLSSDDRVCVALVVLQPTWTSRFRAPQWRWRRATNGTPPYRPVGCESVPHARAQAIPSGRIRQRRARTTIRSDYGDLASQNRIPTRRCTLASTASRPTSANCHFLCVGAHARACGKKLLMTSVHRRW